MERQENLNRWKVGWGITNLCNMNCSFCYSKIARTDEKDIPISILKSFVDRNHLYIDSINYGTGENTLSKTWVDVLQYVHETYQIGQALTTNGSLKPLVDNSGNGKSILKALDEVDVSLDYADKHRHCQMRGHRQAYDWAVDTIKLCQDNGIETTIVILGIDDTLEFSNLDGIFEIAEKHNAFVRINIFRPNARQNLKPLSYQRLKKVLNYLLKNHSVVSLSDCLFSALLLNQEMKDNTGISSLRILPDGSITPSTYLVTPEWKRMTIHDAFLADASFSESLSKNIHQTAQNIAECQFCQIHEICKGGTLDRRVIWYGGTHERDPYCPTRYDETVAEWRYSDHVKLVEGPKIHDGYLPTLIFAP